MTYIRLGSKVNFTKDERIIDRCFEESPVLTSQFGDHREFIIAYYLTEAWAEFNSFSEGLTPQTYSLINPYDAQEVQYNGENQ